ncbi:MAG: Gfo/Idh/MocA family oxidoreductase [Candidatus Omnitrophica bacterium]|nr:Gfo/Idh/MocA family oxidoreductase [Candidatus Omnitrophota bacterium]
MLNFGVIGYGYWGPNIVRNLMSIRETNVKMISDLNPKVLERAQENYPSVEITTDIEQIFKNPGIDVVAIITPVSTHFQLAKRALECGKHIFVEKPFTFNVKQAEELITLAERNRLTIMVDHTFLFTGAVRRIKEEIDHGLLGDIYYYDSTRVNLGLFQQDVNVIWDLAPHDFSILDYLLMKTPTKISAVGIDHFDRGIENIAYVTMYFQENLIAHFNFNWLSPVKMRNTLIGGSKRMLVWDDLQTDEKLKIYDKGVDIDSKEGIYRSLIDYRLGDMRSPRVDPSEALKQELIYLVKCIENNQTPINDGHAGLRVVRMLEATDESLKHGGKVIKI